MPPTPFQKFRLGFYSVCSIGVLGAISGQGIWMLKHPAKHDLSAVIIRLWIALPLALIVILVTAAKMKWVSINGRLPQFFINWLAIPHGQDHIPLLVLFAPRMCMNKFVMHIGETYLYCYCFLSAEKEMCYVLLSSFFFVSMLIFSKIFSTRQHLMFIAQKTTMYTAVAIFQNLITDRRSAAIAVAALPWITSNVCMLDFTSESLHLYLEFNPNGGIGWAP